MNTKKQWGTLALVSALSVSLAACGGGSSEEVDQNASFSLAISDAPVDGVDKVMLCFGSVELVGNGLGNQTFTPGLEPAAANNNTECLDNNGAVVANSIGVDLLTLPGATSLALISQATVPAGNYGQMRLNIVPGSYIQLTDGTQYPLEVPSNQLRLNGVTLSAGGTFSYTLEFDLRKAMVLSNPQKYLLKPTGLRLVNTSEIGHLEGDISEAVLLANNCTVAPADQNQPVAAVYLYPGADLDLSTLADYGGTEAVSPYASAPVLFDGASSYGYELGFIDAGNYTAALTCQLNDEPEQNDDVVFLQGKNLTVTSSAAPVQLDF